MVAEEHFNRQRIIVAGQHPLRHSASEMAYAHQALTGVTNIGAALDYLAAVLFPQAKDDVATVAALPSSGNAINDYRIVLDDGDGKAAGYRWEQREGDAVAKWYKVADWDWSADQIVAGMFQKTLYQYVHKAGFDDTDSAGSPLTGVNAGQHVYGGASASTHLTLHANSGDGVGAQTGYVQFADQVRPTADNVVDLGTTASKWKQVWANIVLAGTLTVAAGSITDSSGAISFGDENLTTTGTSSAAKVLLGDGDAAHPSGAFTSDLDTGLYRVGADELGVAAGGSRVASFGAGWLDLVAGSAANPSVRFAGDVNTGLYAPGADQLGIATGGVARMLFAADGGVTVNATDLAIDASNHRVGMGTASPSVDLHLYKAAQATLRIESRSTTAGNASRLQFYRAGALGANVAASDDVGILDAYAMVGAAYTWLSAVQTRYRGNGSSQYADMIWATANNGNPAERMRLRYDGNLGIGVSDPTYMLHVSGAAAFGNVSVTTNTVATTNTDGNLSLAPNGAGVVSVTSNVVPSADNTKALGSAAAKWSALYLGSAGIGDGTNTIATDVLMSLRDINAGVGSGYSLFYNGSKWVASLPDTEVDHGTISGLGDDDHSQYMLLGGRSGGQFLYGGVASGGNLYLISTAHATRGVIMCYSRLIPSADLTYDLGAAAIAWKDLYVSGQLIGARLQNSTTAARPSASASTPGRILYDTDLKDVYLDTGGTWVKVSVEKYVTQDAATWNGSATTQTYTVSGSVSDARECVWAFKRNGNAFEQLYPEITMTQTQVTVTFGIAPASGTYTLVGVG